MIQLVDQALERHLRAAVPLNSSVEVSFRTPDRAWSGGVTSPTVNVFLWDVSRNTKQTQVGVQQVEHDGAVQRRFPNPVMDLRYLVTAWAGEQRDEHQLLGAVLIALLGHPIVAAEHLAPALQGSGPVRVSLADAQEARSADLWSALDGQLKPGLQVVASLQVDTGQLLEVGPPATGLDVRTEDRSSGARSGRQATEDGGRFTVAGDGEG